MNESDQTGSESYIFKDNDKIISFTNLFNNIFESLLSYFSEKCSSQCKVQKAEFVLLYKRLENQYNIQ